MENAIKDGISVMKFVMNHPSEFESPSVAFFMGFSLCIIAFMSEASAVLIISSVNDTITVILQQVSLATLAKIPQFYATAIP